MNIDKAIEDLEKRKDEAVNKASRLNIQHKIDMLKKKKRDYDNN